MNEYKNRDWLYRKYWKEGLTQRQIAERNGVHHGTASRWMRKFGILARSRSELTKELWEKGAFDNRPKEQIPWNKGLKRTRRNRRAGLNYFYHNGSSTKFKRGHRPWNRMPVGTIRVRETGTKGKRRNWIKTAEPDVWMVHARYVWGETRGRKIPIGFEIRHKDRNPLNDKPGNLICISKGLHFTWLRIDIKDFESKRIRKIRMAYQEKRQVGALNV